MIHAAIQQKLTQHCKTNILQFKKNHLLERLNRRDNSFAQKKEKERTVSYVCNYKMPC